MDENYCKESATLCKCNYIKYIRNKMYCNYNKGNFSILNIIDLEDCPDIDNFEIHRSKRNEVEYAIKLLNKKGFKVTLSKENPELLEDDEIEDDPTGY